MRYILTMILVMASLISAGSAVNNYIEQSNFAQADGTGTATISNSQENFGLIVGDDNTLIQSNNGVSSTSGLNSVLSLTQSNAQVIIGDSNMVSQDNLAWLNINGGMFNSITETQSNLGVIVGDENSASQSNAAWDVIESGENNVITDTQSNLGVQIGDENTLEQINEKLNFATTEESTYDWTLLPWSIVESSSIDYTPVAGAVIVGGANNVITQTQSNVAVQVGTGNEMDQYNDAMANIVDSSSSTVTQNQDNTGVQIGNWNTLFQENLLKNYATTIDESDVVDTLFGFPYHIGEYSTIVNTPVPGALIQNSNYVAIDQTQSNVAVQAGVGNYADQSNDAKADIYWSSESTITQTRATLEFR
jgi:hypothetical protein